jgi:hypothetical protein
MKPGAPRRGADHDSCSEKPSCSGRLGRAHQLLTSAVALYERVGATSGQALAMHRLADVTAGGGRRNQAIGLLQHSFHVAEQSWLEPHAVVRIPGTLIAATANPHAATRRRRRRPQARRAQRAPAQFHGIPPNRRSRLRSRRPPRPSPVRTPSRRANRRNVAGGAWHAAIWEAHGVLRQAEGDTARTAALYNEAADQFAELGRPLDRDRCRAAAQQTAVAGSLWGSHPCHGL